MISRLKKTVGSIPVLGKALRRVYQKLSPNTLVFETSGQYWEDRYKIGGTSGSGSYGRLAEFKAEFLNEFVRINNIQKIVEFGCGDGAQLALAKYPEYLGFDVSSTSVKMCRERFSDNPDFSFDLVGSESYENLQPVELTLSLDVIYHLIEDQVYCAYMEKLFESSSRYVVIYAYDFDRVYESKHEKGRNFTRWIVENAPNWKLIDKIPNKFPYDASDPDTTSQSDFYVYQKGT